MWMSGPVSSSRLARPDPSGRTLARVLRGLLIAGACALVLWLLAILVLLLIGRRSQARELVAVLPNLVVLFRGLLADPRVPRSSKRWLLFALVWCISPIDLIPEFIPVAGPLDDAIVAALVLRHVLRRTDRAVLADHWRGDPAVLDAAIRLGKRAEPVVPDDRADARGTGRGPVT